MSIQEKSMSRKQSDHQARIKFTGLDGSIEQPASQCGRLPKSLPRCRLQQLLAHLRCSMLHCMSVECCL